VNWRGLGVVIAFYAALFAIGSAARRYLRR
jgi:hypothetical protein